MDSEEEVGSGNNSNDGAIEGRGHSNTWDFEEGEYRAPLLCAISNIARKPAHHVSHTVQHAERRMRTSAVAIDPFQYDRPYPPSPTTQSYILCYFLFISQDSLLFLVSFM